MGRVKTLLPDELDELAELLRVEPDYEDGPQEPDFDALYEPNGDAGFELAPEDELLPW